jgi:uncharacterized membrane protein YgcG
MRYKLTAAAFFHAAALACLTAGCARAPQTAGFVGPEATPRPAASAAPSATPNPCPEGVQSPLPPPTGYVNDYASVIEDAARQRLEEKLARLKERAKIELAVVTVETTGGQDIARYSLVVARCWGIGPPAGEEGGGVLLLVAVKDRKWHTQVSRSLERDLPNDEVAEIGSRMRPHFVAGAYGPGVEAGVNAVIARLAEKRNFSPD